MLVILLVFLVLLVLLMLLMLLIYIVQVKNMLQKKKHISNSGGNNAKTNICERYK